MYGESKDVMYGVLYRGKSASGGFEKSKIFLDGTSNNLKDLIHSARYRPIALSSSASKFIVFNCPLWKDEAAFDN